ncbi:MAG: ABC transporter permease subunit [Oscillospiraceae bacterium]|jgi:putative aldouronate transport system permease protein|nr:ABC transporter permease subunit [Oscillospiraceae bacterium]
MTSAGAVSHAPPKRTAGQMIARDFRVNWAKYLIVLPVLAYLALFAYKPLYGLVIAFKEYRPTRGIVGSPWVGLKQFRSFLGDVYTPRILRNTLSISALTILFGFPTPILLALLLNELRSVRFKRVVQTITYMPYFISMIVAMSIVRIYTSSSGMFSQLIVSMGGQAQNLLINPRYFYPIYVISDLWQYIGWNSIIYLAALTSIDQEQYEAARIDGASRLKQVVHITIPGLAPTIVILFILRMGGILNVGYEKVLLLYSDPTYEVADVISTYVYRRGILGTAVSYSTAVGLFNSVVNVVFLLGTNWISRRVTQSGLF